MSTLLPIIPDRDVYKTLFHEPHHWARAVAHLMERHGLSGEITRGVFGSHIVYRIGNVWLKMMAPIFCGDMDFELSGLRAVAGNLSVATPEIVAVGELEGWRYVIMTHVEGEPIRDLWSAFDDAQKLTLTDQLGRATQEMRRCRADDIITKRFEWNAFIEKQYRECEDQQRKKGLPDAWLADVTRFISKFDLSEFQSTSPVFLHADLTFDHFLVSGGIQPKVSGVIDMADCQVGHPEYELVAPAVFIFKGETELLSRYLQASGCGPINANFSENLLAWSMFHRYFSMITNFGVELAECEPGDFESLASRVFPLG